MIQFLNEHCGTHRSATGLLNDLAGKVAPLDTLASEFFTAKTDRQAIIARAQEALTSVDSTARTQASYYVKAMERVVEKGEAWLVKEQGRYVIYTYRIRRRRTERDASASQKGEME